MGAAERLRDGPAASHPVLTQSCGRPRPTHESGQWRGEVREGSVLKSLQSGNFTGNSTARAPRYRKPPAAAAAAHHCPPPRAQPAHGLRGRGAHPLDPEYTRLLDSQKDTAASVPRGHGPQPSHSQENGGPGEVFCSKSHNDRRRTAGGPPTPAPGLQPHPASLKPKGRHGPCYGF